MEASPPPGDPGAPSGLDPVAPGEGDDDATGVAPEAAPFDPSLIRDPPPQPLFSLRRLVIVAVLAVAVGGIVVAARAGGGSGGAGADAAVVAYDPQPGGQVARQAPIGVELEAGYDGRLTIDGVAIPEEQMVGAIAPGTEAAAELPAEQRDLGPRPNNKNLVKYQPGPGKAVTEYDTGAVQVSVRFWRIADGPQDSRTITYTIKTF